MRRESRIFRHKVATAIVFFTVAISLLTVTRTIGVVQASGPIYIRADGSVDPAAAPILRDGDLYSLTADVNFVNDGIVIEKNNTVFDGQGHSLTGPGRLYSYNGVTIVERNNVTLRNLEIRAFKWGVLLEYSERCLLVGNNITSSQCGIYARRFSSINTFSENNITANDYGIYFAPDLSGNFFASNNTITRNQVSNNNKAGIIFQGSEMGYENSDNVVSENVIANNPIGLQMVWGFNNTISGNYIEAIEDGVDLVAIIRSVISENMITVTNGNGVTLRPERVYHGIRSTSVTTVSRNVISVENGSGVAISGCGVNIVSGNAITADNGSCIYLYPFRNYGYGTYEDIPAELNLIYENSLKAVDQSCIQIVNSSSNSIFHNSLFAQNADPVSSENSLTVWDDDYPSGGNYWSDYTGTDADGDGIGDTTYIIDTTNEDRYPLMEAWSASTMTQTLTRTIDFLGLPKRTERRLAGKLNDAIKALDTGNENGAIRKLMAFMSQVEAQSGKKLTYEQADLLISEAQRIIALIEE